MKDDIDLLEGLESRLSDVEVLFELGREEADDSVEAEVEAGLAALTKEFDALELRSLYSGEHDERDAVCEVHSGAGGTDAQDWAEMLLRMYLRWAERRGFTVELEEVTAGQEAGITSATLIVRGRYAYGLMVGEKGVHRLVRISPFDSQARRHTAFASFEAVPYLEEASEEVDIDEKDLRIDTYRSSGAGGQHVNVTDSAVRITHLPTGIVVSCQNQRSQHQNKDVAMKILAAKLAERAREDRRAELAAIAGVQREVAWGSQNPLVCAPAVPDGQGPPHGSRIGQRERRPRRRPRRLHGGLFALAKASRMSFELAHTVLISVRSTGVGHPASLAFTFVLPASSGVGPRGGSRTYQ